MNKFEILDISGDVGIKAFGKDIKEAFVHAALGMFSLITDLETIQVKKAIDVTVESDSLDGLIVSWLNELIFHFDTYGFIGRKIEVNEFTPTLTLPSPRRVFDPRGEGKGEGEVDKIASQPTYKIKASIRGEEFDQQRHEGRLLIKAATYHKLKIEKKHGMFEIRVIFDI